MKDFSRPAGRLRKLSLPARLLYSIFLGFTLIAIALTSWLLDAMVGVDLEGMDAYYAGKAETPLPPDLPRGGAEGGASMPRLELPEELELPLEAEPMPRRKLLEISHFHLFSMPVYLLILAHLYMLSRSDERWKIFWILLASASTALHILAPWIATAGGA
ncbi:MAG: hypothetical protein OEY14_18000, partial [Myxococcales bacterium]|nr:hypothetical protein [Myxococcales bacterium]